MWSIYCLFIARINKLVDAYICARARISKAKMNENDENVDPMRDALRMSNICVQIECTKEKHMNVHEN